MSQRKFAIVTGASSGIGYELAKIAAREGYDLLIAADEPLVDASSAFEGVGVDVQSVEADLATEEGVNRLVQAAGSRPVDILIANAGHGLGRAFLEQDPQEWRHVVHTNVTGTLLLVQPIARRMAARGDGRILFTGSIAGHLAGSFQAVYNGSKAFVDSFAAALGNELKGSGVTVTCLKPGATDTNFFERAGMMDTKIGTARKDDPADVAKTGWDAMMKGQSSVVHGLMNKAQVLASGVLPESVTAEMHRKQAAPGTAEQ
jgi:short-subunit dehydrogenase